MGGPRTLRGVRRVATLLAFVAACWCIAGAHGEPDSLAAALSAGKAAIGKSEASANDSSLRQQPGNVPIKSATPLPPSDIGMQDPVTRGKYLKALGRYYDYRSDGYAFRSRVFDWQLLSSRFIFVIVLLLVLSGIYFAAVQFHVALVMARNGATTRQTNEVMSKPTTPAGSAEAQRGASPLNTQLEISAKGIVVNSSVLGVVILTLSLAFFYLYLVYVYPINDAL